MQQRHKKPPFKAISCQKLYTSHTMQPQKTQKNAENRTKTKTDQTYSQKNRQTEKHPITPYVH